MSELSFYDPLALDSMQPLFKRMFSPMLGSSGLESEIPKIRIDVEEKDKTYFVRADIPGMKKEDISVRIDGNLVQIDAQSHRDHEVKEKGRVLRNERYFGASSRIFSLAHEVDEAKAVAKYEDGVLSLELPIQEAVGKTRIAVQ